MPRFVALLRGINVGGARPMTMQRLREIVGGMGMGDVRTYLQSGNVAFSAARAKPAALAAAIERAILGDRGMEVSAAVLTALELTGAVRRNPLLGMASVDPAFLHATFLVDPKRRPSPAELEVPLGPDERVAVDGDVVYLYCPNGYANTKLQNGFLERKFSARATTRNWRTVSALEAMARGGDP